jgi:hypothetical protein
MLMAGGGIVLGDLKDKADKLRGDGLGGALATLRDCVLGPSSM